MFKNSMRSVPSLPWKTAGQGAAEPPCWRGSEPRAASQQCWGGSWTIPRRCPFHSHAVTPLSCFLPNRGFLLGFEASESRNWSHTSIFLTIINNYKNSHKKHIEKPQKTNKCSILILFLFADGFSSQDNAFVLIVYFCQLKKTKQNRLKLHCSKSNCKMQDSLH